MNLCDCRERFANDKEMARRRSGAASRDSDEVIHKTHRQSCRRINQCFLNSFYDRMPGHWACMLTALDWSSRLRTEIFTRWTCMPVMDSVLVLIFFCSSRATSKTFTP